MLTKTLLFPLVGFKGNLSLLEILLSFARGRIRIFQRMDSVSTTRKDPEHVRAESRVRARMCRSRPPKPRCLWTTTKRMAPTGPMARARRGGNLVMWIDEIRSHHFETMVDIIACWYLWGESSETRVS